MLLPLAESSGLHSRAAAVILGNSSTRANSLLARHEGPPRLPVAGSRA